MSILFFLFLTIALFMQTTVTSIPLILPVLLLFYIVTRSTLAFAAAFFFGIIFDVLTVQTIGTSSAFFLGFLFLVSLYERKFEVNSVYFIAIFSFVGGSIILLLTKQEYVIPQATVVAVIAVLSFLVIQKSAISFVNE